MIGNALKELSSVPNLTDNVVVATKVGNKVARDGGVEGGLSAVHVKAECRRSLVRLQVSSIDILYAHKPDEDGVPLSETIGAFAELIAEKKIKHWAV
jgi:aryl-alcohol dehydrogenase-like predicted oxidoreductase